MDCVVVHSIVNTSVALHRGFAPSSSTGNGTVLARHCMLTILLVCMPPMSIYLTQGILLAWTLLDSILDPLCGRDTSVFSFAF